MGPPAQRACAQPGKRLSPGLPRLFSAGAEKTRRWPRPDDTPGARCTPRLNPAVADVVESFLAVELYLPDYVASAMSLWRPSRAFSWFYANWGYEESKHSLALADWLLRSRMRSDGQMADLEGQVLRRPSQPPHARPPPTL